MADDPFAVFGVDEDESDLGGDIPSEEERKVAQSLITTANHRMKQKREETTLFRTTQPDVPKSTVTSSSVHNKSLPDSLEFPLWKKPLFFNPSIVVCAEQQGIGGQRGLIARQDLGPGSLILVENHAMIWPQPFSLLTVLEALLQRTDAIELIHALEQLHPRKLVVDRLFTASSTFQQTDVESEEYEQTVGMIQFLDEMHGQDENFKSCVAFAEETLHNSDGTSVAKMDLLRVLAALRYNALESGLFFFSAMLNHGEPPNCVKFLPTHEKKYSEVRATREIKRGDALTISYFSDILSHVTRRKILWNQHRFDIGSMPSESIIEMEIVKGKVPSVPLVGSNVDTQSPTRRIEDTVEQLRENMRYVRDSTQLSTFTGDIVTEAQALELSLLELGRIAPEELGNDRHVLLASCLSLHVDACDLLLNDQSMPPKVRGQLLVRLIASSSKLFELQRSYFGTEHIQLATTLSHLYQAIEELLSFGSSFVDSLDVYGNTLVFSKKEYEARKESLRLKLLYPDDVGKLINN